MVVGLIESVILSIVQGITEWLPVSSSGHLALIQNLFGFQNLPFDVFLHVASIIAVIFIFRKDIAKLFDLRQKENRRYLFIMLIALIPAGIIGFFFQRTIEKSFSNMLILGILFVISGILIYSTKFFKSKKEKISIFDSFFIGMFQAVAILPGISRSGATISSGLIRGVSKEQAIKFSFLLSIPVVLGASLLKAKDLLRSQIQPLMLLISFVITLIVSVITIKVLLKIIKGK